MNSRNGKLPPAPTIDWAYFLDVDGTLLDIAATPNAVRVDQALLKLLERLHRASGGAVALISGRAISDLDRRLGNLRLPRTLAGRGEVDLEVTVDGLKANSLKLLIR